jgi:hypothetical protein
MKTNFGYNKNIFINLFIIQLILGLSLNQCPAGSVENDLNCTTCLSLNKVYYNSVCTANCPDGAYQDANGICQEIASYTGKYFINKVYSCEFEQKSCQNGGTCSFRFQYIHCECKTGFTGLYCHLDFKNIPLHDYISKKNLT